MLCANMQIALHEKSLESLAEKRDELLKARDSAEAECRTRATAGGGLAEQEVKEIIEEARELLQKPKLLQAIHVAHQAVVANNEAIKHEKQELTRLREQARECDTNMPSLKAELQQKENEVHTRLLMHTRTCPLF